MMRICCGVGLVLAWAASLTFGAVKGPCVTTVNQHTIAGGCNDHGGCTSNSIQWAQKSCADSNSTDCYPTSGTASSTVIPYVVAAGIDCTYTDEVLGEISWKCVADASGQVTIFGGHSCS